MNDFTLHTLQKDIQELERHKKSLDLELSQVEPLMKQEISTVERKYGVKRTTIQSKLRQTETDLRTKKAQLFQLEKRIEREQQRAKQ